MQALNLLALVTMSILIKLALCENEDYIAGVYKLEGKVSPPDNIHSDDFLTRTKVLINGGEYMGFVRDDGYFVINSLPSGSYVVEIANPEYMYEPARVEINFKGKIRARKLNLIQSTLVQPIAYPLKFKMKSKLRYFQQREQWRVTDFLFSPMVLMMILPLLVIMIMPKLMSAAGPETQREMQSLQSPDFNMPDLAETFTSWFDGGKKQTPKAVKATKKRN